MNYKKFFSAVVVSTLILPQFTVSVGAQSWYDEALNLSSVLGNDTSRKPSKAPQEKPTRPNNSSNKPEKTTPAQDKKPDVDNMRKNDFDELVENRKLTKEERKAKVEEWKTLKEEERCERAQNNVQRRIDYYSNSETHHATRYNGIARRVQNAVDRLSALGYDTSSIEEKLEELNTMIAELNVLHDQLSTTMTVSKASVCEEGSEEQNFKEQLQGSKDTLAEIRTQVFEIRSLIQDELVEAIKEVAQSDKYGEDGPDSGPVDEDPDSFGDED